LTIFGPWRGEDEAFFQLNLASCTGANFRSAADAVPVQDEAFFQSVLSYFTEATGIDVKYSSSVTDPAVASAVIVLDQLGVVIAERRQEAFA
ncbi:hypothetical protein ACC732_36350, partial [Rhizobium ruizarguesonis]